MSNHSSDRTSDIHREVAEQGVEYLEGLDPSLDVIEQSILALTEPGKARENLNLIAREAHSIKGTAGIFKFDLISIICHSLEDRVMAIKLESQSLETQIDGLLRYVDAIGAAARAYLRGDQSRIDEIARELGLVSRPASAGPSPVERRKRRILVIEKMGSLLQFISSGLRSYDSENLEIAVSPDGYDGLGRLLRERFDCIFMSNLSDLIRGDELVKVLSSVSSPNAQTPMILLTSDQRLKIPDSNRKVVVIAKGADLTERIRETMTSLFGVPAQNPTSADLKVHEVLLVDDSVPIQRVVQMVLKKNLNLQIKIASTGAEALAMLKNYRPDLILLDYLLPDMDGVELAGKIKLLQPNLPFLFLTGADKAEDHEHLRSVGPVGIIKKPFPPMDLVKWVTEHTN